MVFNGLPSYFLQTTLSFYLKLSPLAAIHNGLQLTMDATPRRAVMYCPGDDLRKINKGLSSKADCIVLDCEDGVAVNRKQEARSTIRDVLNSESLPLKPEVAVRVNSVDSGFCEDDLASIFLGRKTPSTLFLPKVESTDNLHWFAEKLSKYSTQNSTVKLVMYAESARAILDLADICKAAVKLSQTYKILPVAIVLGSDDLCASIGVARSVDGAEILYARQKLVLVAKAFGLQAIDMVHIQYKDLESLKSQSEAGARLGYTGKQVIHPGQIDIVQKAFSPSPKQVEWAIGVIKGFQQSQQQGKGAFVHEGQMIDMPLLRQAENIIRMSDVDQNS